MKLNNFLSLLSLAAGLAAHEYHDEDESEWTKEQLDELEAKWGQEVRDVPSTRTFLMIKANLYVVGVHWPRIICPSGVCQVSYRSLQEVRHRHCWCSF